MKPPAHYRALTDAQVREVLTTPDISAPAWAKHFGVSQQTISAIRAGLSYKHVYAEVHPSQPIVVRERMLTDQQAQRILDTPEISGNAWAARLGVAPNTIWRLRHGLTYKHLKRPKPSK